MCTLPLHFMPLLPILSSFGHNTIPVFFLCQVDSNTILLGSQSALKWDEASLHSEFFVLISLSKSSQVSSSCFPYFWLQKKKVCTFIRSMTNPPTSSFGLSSMERFPAQYCIHLSLASLSPRSFPKSVKNMTVEVLSTLLLYHFSGVYIF